MPELSLIVRNKVGLHARSAVLFVQTARQFSSRIIVWHKDRFADATDVVKLVTLAIYQDSEIIVKAEGEDAEMALTALKNLVENNFGEPL